MSLSLIHLVIWAVADDKRRWPNWFVSLCLQAGRQAPLPLLDQIQAQNWEVIFCVPHALGIVGHLEK